MSMVGHALHLVGPTASVSLWRFILLQPNPGASFRERGQEYAFARPVAEYKRVGFSLILIQLTKKSVLYHNIINSYVLNTYKDRALKKNKKG